MTKRAPRPRLPLFTGQLITRERLPAPKELTLHFSIAKELRRFARPDWRWTHFPAGELRDDNTGAKLKRMGLMPGWPDFQIISPAGLYHALELKRHGEDLNDDQRDFAEWCTQHGVPHVMADTFQDAMMALNQWGCLRVQFAGGLLR